MQNETGNELGSRIRQLREQAGMTQEELAEELDVSRQAVSKWEADLSRPSSDKLIRLSQVLNTDLGRLIGAESREEGGQPEIEEAPSPIDTQTETPAAPNEGRRKRFPAAAVVGIVLALVFVFAAALILALRFAGSAAYRIISQQPSVEAVENVQADVNTETPAPAPMSGSEVLPATLRLTAREWRSFGDTPNRDEVVDAASVAQDLLFRYDFPGTQIGLVFYREESTYIDEQGGPLWHLMAAADYGDGQYWTVARIAEDEPEAGRPALSTFQALGISGCKVLVHSWRFEQPDTYYFTLSQDGQPTLWGLVNGEAAETDIDADGENEIIPREPDISKEILFDRNVDDFLAYRVEDELPDGASIRYGRVPDTLTGEEALLLALPDGRWTAYRHLHDEELSQEKQAFSAFGMEGLDEKVSSAVLVFGGAEQEVSLSDGRDPDQPEPLDPQGRTPRQLAYLALQSLYDLTGYAPERCFVRAYETSVYFNLDENFDNQCFLSVCFGGQENEIPGIELSWHQKYVEYSPLEPERTALAGMDKKAQALWAYEQLPALQAGEIVDVGEGLQGDLRLYLDDGRFFEVSFDEGCGLVGRVQGPYPKGFEH